MTTYEKGTYLDVKEKEWDARSDSVLSYDTSETLIDDPNFHPGTVFHVNAQGIRFVRLPLPSSELEINVFKSDGSLAYISNREKRCSGDSILSHSKLGDLVSTSYHFGPGRQPELCLLQSSTPDTPVLKVKGQWTSRSIDLTDNNNHTFRWSYETIKEPNGKKVNVLVLCQREGKADGKILAQLIRSDETRTPGTNRARAGNGGQLVIDEKAPALMDEALIVATCLMMLKKEIDRRRAVQFAILAGMASGGGGP